MYVRTYLVEVEAHAAVEERQQPEDVELLGDAVYLQVWRKTATRSATERTFIERKYDGQGREESG